MPIAWLCLADAGARGAADGTPAPLLLFLLSNGFVTALVVAAVNAVSKWREPYVALEARRRDELRREQARVQSDYLRPLSRLTRELSLRLGWMAEALADGASDNERARVDHLSRSVKRVKDQMSRDDVEAFLLFCNGEGVDGVDAMYACVSYFSIATQVRRALPYIQVVLDRPVDELGQALAEVELAFNADGLGIYETVQRSMGLYVLNPDGTRKEYAAFCELLAGRSTHPHFLCLYDFLVEIRRKRDYQLRQTVGALPRLERAVAELLGAA